MKSLFRTVKHMLSSPNAGNDIGITINEGTALTPNIIDATETGGYLAGQLLVATPVIDSGMFARAVVYVFSHGKDGAMGLIINQPLEMVSYSALVEGTNLPAASKNLQIPVFSGGPVERNRGFVLHSSDYVRDFTLARSGELAVTTSNSILNDIVAGNGPKQASLIVGCAGWSAGQLEAEIEQNSWINVPATEKLVFGTENELKWATASKSLGIDMAFYSTAVGHA